MTRHSWWHCLICICQAQQGQIFFPIYSTKLLLEKGLLLSPASDDLPYLAGCGDGPPCRDGQTCSNGTCEPTGLTLAFDAYNKLVHPSKFITLSFPTPSLHISLHALHLIVSTFLNLQVKSKSLIPCCVATPPTEPPTKPPTTEPPATPPLLPPGMASYLLM